MPTEAPRFRRVILPDGKAHPSYASKLGPAIHVRGAFFRTISAYIHFNPPPPTNVDQRRKGRSYFVA
jgi:hypothetical protein